MVGRRKEGDIYAQRHWDIPPLYSPGMSKESFLELVLRGEGVQIRDAGLRHWNDNPTKGCLFSLWKAGTS